jgi:phosphoglycolate phosphatase-like HAD superfamily hydrolase
MKAKNLIIFDMDGVIIDVSGSYREVVRQTTKLFFQPARSWENLPEPLFELSDLAAVKQSGGLNNDWDLTCLVINLLYSLTAGMVGQKTREPWTGWHDTMSRCDVTGIAEYLMTMDQPLVTLLRQKGREPNDFIARTYTGDVGSGNIIKQIFQEIYLGGELFERTYGLKPKIYSDRGYILKEKVLIDRSILKDLSRDNVLAIATGRPQAEAEYPIKYFDLTDYFKLVYTLDDCLKKEDTIFREQGKKVSLSKPHPFMLDAIAESLKHDFNGYYYIGDMPDDILAAANSRFEFQSIGTVVSAPDKAALKKKLRRAGANFLIEDFGSLKEIFL